MIEISQGTDRTVKEIGYDILLEHHVLQHRNKRETLRVLDELEADIIIRFRQIEYFESRGLYGQLYWNIEPRDEFPRWFWTYPSFVPRQDFASPTFEANYSRSQQNYTGHASLSGMHVGDFFGGLFGW